MSSRTEQTVVNPYDGTKLFVRKWNPPSAPVAKMVIIHGYLEHGGRYREFAEYLSSEHNICTLAYDLRGHGKSSGQRAYLYEMKENHTDLEAVLDFGKNDKHSTVPIFVLAHSFGGLTFLDYARENMALQQKIKGCIITSPFVDYADALGTFKVLVSRVLGRIMPRLSLPVEELPVENLTNDVQKQKEHDEDPANLHSFTIGWALECLNTQLRVRETIPIVIPVPVLYVIAELDKVADVEAVTKVGQNIEQKDKTVVLRKGEQHEVLNEVKRQETYKIIGEWIANRLD
eukprot:CAMPEP_0198138594 /NCGR_PEP_ID=MMETSP1443-20131203/1975_1 /TAXON_ID=186043 /ORGANISM="Entomoneis sp., Strain CCMP2396" /LENGTH=287 /DNA_ID=CAMNT_0043800423 /DNA_START=129 /DNA_END=992 /DNA_ORIENTATION=+